PLHQQQPAREELRLFATPNVEGRVPLRTARRVHEIVRGLVRVPVADQEQDPVHAHARLRVRLLAPRLARANAATSSRRHTRPEARRARGSGKEPRSTYVITRRLSQPSSAAASATPTSAGHTSTVSTASSPTARRSRDRQAARVGARTSRSASSNRPRQPFSVWVIAARTSR